MKKILLFLLAAVLLLQFCCASAESFPVLSVGDNGPEVLEVKERLRELRYITEKQHSERAWEDIRKSFEDTICQWLENFGERHYEFEFVRQNEPAV